MRPLALVLALAACAPPAPAGAPAGAVDGGDGLGPGDDLDDDGAPAAADGGPDCAVAWPSWNDGASCPEPELQVFQLDADTFVLRQSLCTSFEGPFLYLLFGDDRALLEDTGAGGVDVVAAVDAVIDGWLAASGRPSIDLVVVNSHAHGDHTAGNAAFAARPGTTMVGTSVAEVAGFFGLDWPTGAATYDLGGRPIDVVPIPGHQGADLALLDRRTGLLLTGDTLYPGRLYVRDFAAYRASIARLASAVDGKSVCHVLGAHIEMTTTPGVDFDFGADAHPAEHPLALGRSQLLELLAAVDAMAAAPAIEAHDDFIVYPL